jgi:NADH:ubiquinone oxidoreductase subunit 2 (subunit N)
MPDERAPSTKYFRPDPILIVLATIGMMVMASANDLIALYMGLELQSLAR